MTKNSGFHQIGEVAKRTGTSVDTIRYYEKEGLLQQPARSEGGFRKYPHEAIERICFIRKAKSFGLTLIEIKEIMKESEKGLEKCCGHVNKVLNRKLVVLESKINELQSMKKSLKTFMKSWIPIKDAKKKPYAVCPQIEGEHKQTKSAAKRGGFNSAIRLT